MSKVSPIPVKLEFVMYAFRSPNPESIKMYL